MELNKKKVTYIVCCLICVSSLSGDFNVMRSVILRRSNAGTTMHVFVRLQHLLKRHFGARQWNCVCIYSKCQTVYLQSKQTSKIISHQVCALCIEKNNKMKCERMKMFLFVRLWFCEIIKHINNSYFHHANTRINWNQKENANSV